MASKQSVGEGGRWIVTDKGKHDLLCAETCNCNPRLIGLLIGCDACGTIYGSLKDSVNWGQGRAEFKR